MITGTFTRTAAPAPIAPGPAAATAPPRTNGSFDDALAAVTTKPRDTSAKTADAGRTPSTRGTDAARHTAADRSSSTAGTKVKADGAKAKPSADARVSAQPVDDDEDSSSTAAAVATVSSTSGEHGHAAVKAKDGQAAEDTSTDDAPKKSDDTTAQPIPVDVFAMVGALIPTAPIAAPEPKTAGQGTKADGGSTPSSQVSGAFTKAVAEVPGQVVSQAGQHDASGKASVETDAVATPEQTLESLPTGSKTVEPTARESKTVEPQTTAPQAASPSPDVQAQPDVPPAFLPAQRRLKPQHHGLDAKPVAAQQAAIDPNVQNVAAEQPTVASEAGSRPSPQAGLRPQSFTIERAGVPAAEPPPTRAAETQATPTEQSVQGPSQFQPSFGEGSGEGEQPPSETAGDAKLTSTATMAVTAAGHTDFAAKLATVQASEDAAPPASHDAENINRLVHTMRVQVRDNVSEATITLRPDNYGEVKLAIKVEGNTVTAVVHAESAGVRQWLETNEEALRTGLAEQGLQLDRFVVETAKQPEQKDDAPRQQQQQEEPQDQRRFRFRRPRNGQEQARFEVEA